MSELSTKLQFLRGVLDEFSLAGFRFRGVDWFAWLGCGASNAVLLSAEKGIAEILVTLNELCVLSDKIETERLRNEEVSEQFQLISFDWYDEQSREDFVARATGGGKVASDCPNSVEAMLPAKVRRARYKLSTAELERYRVLGKGAAEAMSEALGLASPDWSEHELAAAGARALYSRGLHPILILAAGSERVFQYRHPVPTEQKLGMYAMMVFCARGWGLVANLTRFVSFRKLSPGLMKAHEDVACVEALLLRESLHYPKKLNEFFDIASQAYGKLQRSGEEYKHHQGGITGYLAREALARPDSTETLNLHSAVAWNPSVAGAKIEDTFFIHKNKLENLTFDHQWPCFKECFGIRRPFPWERGL